MSILSPQLKLPEKKRLAIAAEFGVDGERWIAHYPALIDKYRRAWGLEFTSMASSGLPINVILFAHRGSDRVVLKVGCPHPEQKTELIALRTYQGRNCVRVLDWDEESDAYLMECILPGDKLREVDSELDRSAIRISLIGDLPVQIDEPISGIPDYGGWRSRAFDEFTGIAGTYPELHTYITRSHLLFKEILAEHEANYLLHGDLHHENILLDEHRGWLAIDPKGVIGPRLMECGRFLHNFIEDEIPDVEHLEEAKESQIEIVLQQRLQTFHEMLGFTMRELAAATFVDLALSSCWTVNSRQRSQDDAGIDAGEGHPGSIDLKRLRVLDRMLR